jgi:LSD1 subclass zinc finger protein
MENAEIKNETLKAFDCSNCGAGLKYKPGTTTLVCEYCNAKNNIPKEEIIVEETDFVAYLEKLEAANSVVEETLQCKSCGAASTVNINAKSSNCPYCSTPLIEGDTKENRAIKPTYLLPFKIDKQKALEMAFNWAKDTWYTKEIQSSSITITSVYVPHWTYDTRTNSNYLLEKTQKNGNNTYTQTLSGDISIFFDDILVPASKNTNNALLAEAGPWNTKNLVNTNDEYLKDYIVEKYTTDLKQGFYLAKGVIDQSIRNNIFSKAGDIRLKIKNVQTKYLDIKFKHILLPVYTLTYEHKGKINQMYVNGYTGKVAGIRPKNPISAFLTKAVKITFIIILAFIFIFFILPLLTLFFI